MKKLHVGGVLESFFCFFHVGDECYGNGSVYVITGFDCFMCNWTANEISETYNGLLNKFTNIFWENVNFLTSTGK